MSYAKSLEEMNTTYADGIKEIIKAGQSHIASEASSIKHWGVKDIALMAELAANIEYLKERLGR